MKRKYLIGSGIALVLSMAFVGTTVAQTVTEQERTVICKLKEVVEDAGRDGYDLVFWPIVRKGPAQVNAPLTLKLDPTVEYLFVGYCDENCSDVNLNVSDQEGEVLKSEEDTLSVIPFEPPLEDDYALNLRMADCSAEDGCVYGIGVLAPRGVKVPYASKLPEELAQFKLCD